MKEINIKQLEIIFDKIIKKLEFEESQKITLNYDYYRYIPTDSWDEFDNDSVETGSLFDDIENLQKLTLDTKRQCSYVDFDRIASVLRAISQKNNPA